MVFKQPLQLAAPQLSSFLPNPKALPIYCLYFLLATKCPIILLDRNTFMHPHTPTTPRLYLATIERPTNVAAKDSIMIPGRCPKKPNPMHTQSNNVPNGQYDWESTANGTSVAMVCCTDTSATNALATAGARRATKVRHSGCCSWANAKCRHVWS